MAKISLGSNYIVTEEDVQSAEVIETVLATVSFGRIEPPGETRHYICPRYYPEYFR